MFFLETKMGPYCKEMQDHGIQRRVKMAHFQKNLWNFWFRNVLKHQLEFTFYDYDAKTVGKTGYLLIHFKTN